MSLLQIDIQTCCHFKIKRKLDSKINSPVDFGSLIFEAAKQCDHEGLELIFPQEVWEWNITVFIISHELFNKICYSLEDFFDIPHGLSALV